MPTPNKADQSANPFNAENEKKALVDAGIPDEFAM